MPMNHEHSEVRYSGWQGLVGIARFPALRLRGGEEAEPAGFLSFQPPGVCNPSTCLSGITWGRYRRLVHNLRPFA